MDLLFVSPESFRASPQIGTACRMTWGELARWLAHPTIGATKDEAGAWSPALYRDGLRRKAALVQTLAIVVDVDEGGDVERVAGLAEDHGIMFVDCPVIGTRQTAKHGRLVVLASGPGDALDRAQPIFDAIGSKTVRLASDAGQANRMRLIVSAWTVGLWESLRYQLSCPARWRARAGAGRTGRPG